jgi:hypothetical protein
MNIKKEEFEKLLEMIPPYPKTNIFHLNNFDLTSSKVLFEFCKTNDYDYDLLSSDDKFLEKLSKFKATKLNIKQPRYNRHAKLYDYVFLTIDLDDIEDKKLFFTKIYHICKNASKILIFLENGYHDELENLLEELNFVASNYIDISKNYRVLSVQKMHGWGVYDL